MSNCVNVVTFNKDTIRLEMIFDGDDYESASVKFRLVTSDMRILEESVTIPIRCLFSMGYLLLMSIRRTAAQYEKEVIEMQELIAKGQHPFKDSKKDI